jgi:hypothetical protein
MEERVQVSVNGSTVSLHRGMRVRHALIAADQSLYERALGGEVRVEDGNGFPLDLDGALADGMSIFSKPA